MQKIKIAYLSINDPLDKRSWSGTTYYIGQTLQKNIGEVDRILTSEEGSGNETGGAQNHRKAIEMRFVHKTHDSLLESCERCLCDNILVLPGLEVAAREQRDEVGEPTSPELGSKSDA